MGNSGYYGFKRPNWWEEPTVSPGLRRILTFLSPPKQAFDADLVADGLRAAIHSIEDHDNLRLAGFTLQDVLKELDGLPSLSAPLSPALKSWRHPPFEYATAYWAFANRQQGWRSDALKRLQALLLYLMTIPMLPDAPVRPVNWTWGPWPATPKPEPDGCWPIQKLAQTLAYQYLDKDFSHAQYFACIPPKFTIRELAKAIRSIEKHSTPQLYQAPIGYLQSFVECIEQLPDNVGHHVINTELARNYTTSQSSALRSENETQEYPKYEQLEDSARKLLESFGIKQPGALDLASFARNAIGSLDSIPENERDSACYAHLSKTLDAIQSPVKSLPLVSPNYSTGTDNSSSALYWSILDPSTRHHFTPSARIASICLRAALLPPPEPSEARKSWQQAIKEAHSIAHAVSWHAQKPPTKGRAKVISCISQGDELATEKAIANLRDLNNEDPEVKAAKDALLLILLRISESLDEKAEKEKQPEPHPPHQSQHCCWTNLSIKPTATQFFKRIGVSGQLRKEFHQLQKTLLELQKINIEEKLKDRPLQMIADVLEALDQIIPLVENDHDTNEGAVKKDEHISLDALVLQPAPSDSKGIRILQILLFQQTCVAPSYRKNLGINTSDLDRPFAELIINTSQITDENLLTQARRYLSNLEPTPGKSNYLGHLWPRFNRDPFGKNDIQTIENVLRCIQYDRDREPPPENKTKTKVRIESPSTTPRQPGPGDRPSGLTTARRRTYNQPRSGLATQGTSNEGRRSKSIQVRAPVRAPTPDELLQLRQNGETVEDILPETDATIIETRVSRVRVARQRAFASRQASAMRQGVWARHQWDALTAEDASEFLEWLIEQERSPIFDYSEREAITACCLMAVTGFSLPRVHAIRLNIEDETRDDAWEPKAGALSFPLPGSDSRFEPSAMQSTHVERAKSRVRILLPVEVAKLARKLKPGKDIFLFATDFEQLSESISQLIIAGRNYTPRLTLARLQRSHQLEVLTQTGDVAVAQMVCGDVLGVAPTPTAYYAARTASLQGAYNKAIERLGLTPKAPGQSEAERVGSKLLVTKEALSSFISTAQKGFIQRPKSARLVGRAAAALHEALVPTLATLFIAGTGHRPTFRLGQMTSQNICLEIGFAVIEDKVCDEQHAARIVPLSPTLNGSLAAYGTHLERLASNESLIPAHRKAATDALSGAGPLFFMFDGQGTRALCVSDLTRCAPPQWPLPKNFLRHRLATGLRDNDCPGVYVQAMLGHLEAGIQPFGTESFMCPASYLRTTSVHVEAMLKADGWKPLLGGHDDVNIFLQHSPPLTSAVLGIQQKHERGSSTLHQQQRNNVQRVRAEHEEEIKSWVKGLIDIAVKAAPDAPTGQRINLDADAVSALRKKICAEAMDLAYTEVAIDTLRSQLQEGASSGHWTVERLPYFHIPRPEPAVFHPSFVRLYASVLRLRRHLIEEISGDPSNSPQDLVRRCILGLILWHGICTDDRLKQVVKGIPQSRPASPLDALIVPTEHIEPATGRVKVSSEVLRGVVALLANAARGVLADGTQWDQLATLIATWVPAEVIDCQHSESLAVLMEAAAATHRFESTGPTRAVWTGAFTSLSLPPERLLALLEARQPEAKGPLNLTAPDNLQHDATGEPPSTVQRRTVQRGYRWLRDLLYYKPGLPKTYPDYAPEATASGIAEASTQQQPIGQNERQIRKEIIRRLEERLDRWPEDQSLLRALTAYSLDRIKNGTPWKTKIELTTVYNYLVATGSALLAQHDGTPLDEIDSEDFHELYDACIQGAKQDNTANLARLLAYFHGFLVSHCGAPGVAIGASKFGAQCFPDVGYVTPVEYDHARRTIDKSIQSSQSESGSTVDLEAAHAAIVLGFASGARTSEVLLRERDEVNLTDRQSTLIIRRNNISRVKSKTSTREISFTSILSYDKHVVEGWKRKTTLPADNNNSINAPFFRDWHTQQTINPSRITRIISAALRNSTGLHESRPYWWRHTLTSNEFITQLGTPDVINALTKKTYSRSLGIGNNCESLGYPPRNIPPCQAHAANFRARRGHSSMRTSVETYVHLIALVEPYASRELCQKLSIDTIARAANLSPDAARKRLTRTRTSAEDRPAVFQTLLNGRQTAPPVASSPVSSQHHPATREIELESVIAAYLMAVKTGKPTFAERALHMTEAEAARWRTAIDAALQTSIYRNRPFGWHTGIADPQGIDIVRSTKKSNRKPKRINKQWVLHCVTSALGDPHIRDAWRIAMKGLDVTTGHIVVSSKEELQTLAEGLTRSFATLRTGTETDVELISSKSTLGGSSTLSFGNQAQPINFRINHSKRFNPPLGYLNVGVTVKSKRNGLTVKSPMLLAALFACASIGASDVAPDASIPTSRH